MMTIANAASSVQRGLAPVRSVLGNGVRVIAKHAGATPAVTLHASFDAGTIFDPPSEPGVSHFVSRTIDRGTAARAADDIAERLENRGVSLAITVNRHALSLVCTCLVEDLDATHRKALTAGANEMTKPHDAQGMPRNCAVKDPSGNWIWLYQR